jgi:hypothetical protein
MTSETSSGRRFSLTWKYGVKARDDYIEIEIGDKQDKKDEDEQKEKESSSTTKIIQLKRWSTFKCHHFPDGAIVVGFRGRRDYKDGVCQGIMCYVWSNEQNHFISCTHTISNGYNSKISATDFETLELCDKDEFTLKNPDAVKSIKTQLR